MDAIVGLWQLFYSNDGLFACVCVIEWKLRVDCEIAPFVLILVFKPGKKTLLLKWNSSNFKGHS